MSTGHDCYYHALLPGHFWLDRGSLTGLTHRKAQLQERFICDIMLYVVWPDVISKGGAAAAQHEEQTNGLGGVTGFIMLARCTPQVARMATCRRL
jgi:hypothetical protein